MLDASITSGMFDWDGPEVTPGGLEQCKLDYEALHGPQGTEEVWCPEGGCKWYVDCLIERQSL